MENSKALPLILDGEYNPLKGPDRSLSAETYRKFSVTIGTSSRGNTLVCFPYRSLKTGEIVAQKQRPVEKKGFRMATGDNNPEEPYQLFGQHLWGGGGRKLIVTEGEFDAMSVSQVQEHKWPVVSVGAGAANALDHLLLNLDFLLSFEEVILMFDMDEQGQKAAKECASELSQHLTIKIAHLPLKDPNEVLMKGRGQELIKATWNATEWKPEGVVSIESLKEGWIKQEACAAVPYPWDGLTAVTMGLRSREMVLLTAGTGVGKTAVCMEMIYDLINRKKKVGLVFREQGWARTIDGLIGLHLGKRIHIARAAEGLPEDVKAIVQKRKNIEDFDAAEAKEAFEELVGSGKIVIDKQWGSEDFEDLLAKIRFMAVSQKCDVIFLDHISIVISGLEIADERKALDVAITKLRDICESTGVALVVVSHLKRPDGNKGFEEGLDVSLSHLRGTQALSQVPDIVIALQRNKKDDTLHNYTEVVVLKNRFTGEDGCTACWLEFKKDTGRLVEVDEPPKAVEKTSSSSSLQSQVIIPDNADGTTAFADF